MAAGAASRSDAAGAPAPGAAADGERAQDRPGADGRAPAATTPDHGAAAAGPVWALLPDGTAVRLSAIDLDLGPGHAFDDHVAVIADDGRGRVIGRAAFRRVYGPRAVFALEVGPEVWHLGLPAILVEQLCERAAQAGIAAFIARVPAAQLELLALLRTSFAARQTRDGTHVDVEFATSRASVTANH
jgi:hypothetical protein